MSRSDQEWQEIGNQVIDNIKHSRERFDQRLTIEPPRLSHDYLERKLRLLLRFKIAEDGNDIFALFYHKPLGERNGVPSLEGKLMAHEARSEQQMMFVSNVETRGLSTEYRSLPCKLLQFDSSDHLRPHTRYFSLTELRYVILRLKALSFGVVDGKSGVTVGRVVASLDQLPSQMIECTSEVMDSIPCNGQDGIRNIVSLLDEKCSSPRKAHVRLGRNFVRLSSQESVDFFPELAMCLSAPSILARTALTLVALTSYYVMSGDNYPEHGFWGTNFRKKLADILHVVDDVKARLRQLAESNLTCVAHYTQRDYSEAAEN